MQDGIPQTATPNPTPPILPAVPITPGSLASNPTPPSPAAVPITPGLLTSNSTATTATMLQHPNTTPEIPTSLTPMPPPPIPASATSSLITNRFQNDHILPIIGQLVKVRLNHPLQGPGSSHISSHAPTGATRNNYHTAIVVSVRVDYHLSRLTLTVYPVPGYTGARLVGIDSRTWLAQQAMQIRNKHIPVPVLGDQNDEHMLTIPVGFGEPLIPLNADGRRYLDHVPSWILVEEFIVHLPWTSIWKSFSPDVVFSAQQLNRLQQWDYNLRLGVLNSNPNSNLQVNMVQIPDYYFQSRGILEELLDGFRGPVHYVPEDEDEGMEAGLVVEDDDDPEVASYLEFARMFGTGDEYTRKLLVEEDKRIEKDKQERVIEWLAFAGQQ